ncbi:MAG: TraR/DksA family transcriptional regulator [Gammaproteobacteria bacterium]|nr:TraR/DksA family transcriptional regulator [Gammaproteobacteria bacterium]MCW8986546.1 TraR/DksA family transcriptional regulator [Gammaproteobacteria bacterium]MCW9030751.1 TraR/DksA family transcriptional regulator [Gammaproteobacteria bacterium]
MNKLTTEQIEIFREALLKQREILTTAVAAEGESSKTVELDQSKVGRLSRMDALQGQAMTQETKHRHEEGLRNITAALSRIESGDYGYCSSCDELISTARLEVDPAASLCINCATLAEKV